MKRPMLFLTAATLAASSLLMTACDWESGSQQNFNTSGLGGLTNISGFYQGGFSGGRAVSNTSAGNIKSLSIQQSGNRVEIVDNQGSRYVGSVGSPGTLAPLGSGTIPSGSNLATYQISFSGKDGVSARDIEFTGTITLITVTDIAGNSGDRARDRTNGVSQSIEETINEETGIDPNTTTRTTTTTTTNNDTTTRNDDSSWQYSLTEASTQFRLRGTWVELGGGVSSVEAIAAGLKASVSSNPGGGSAEVL